MGDGEFVGNQSVHWKIDHRSPQDLAVGTQRDEHVRQGDGVNVKRQVHGRDPKPAEDFTVRLRFDTAGQARERLQDALRRLEKVEDTVQDFYVTLVVPATVRGQQRSTPTQNPTPDIHVAW